MRKHLPWDNKPTWGSTPRKTPKADNEPINVTHHFMLRLLQRRHKSKDSDTKLEFRIKLEAQQLREEAWELYGKARHIWSGILKMKGEEQEEPVSFHLYDEPGERWILISDIPEDNLVTMYELVFEGLPEAFNEELIQKLFGYIKRTDDRLDSIKSQKMPYIERRRHYIEEKEAECAKLKEKLAKAEGQIESWRQEIAKAASSFSQLETESEQLKKMLCAPYDFVKDMNRIRKFKRVTVGKK